MSLTSFEEELAANLGFDPVICDYIKSNMGNRPLERAICLDEDYDLAECDAISILAPSDDTWAFIDAHREYLQERSYRPYLGERTSDDHGGTSEELVILHTDDPYEIVRQRSTNGDNYGVGNEDVIAKLRDWEQLCQFQILQAEASMLILNFETLPQDICSFAGDVYAFCPDTVDQGVGNMNEHEHPQLFAAARELCSDSFTDVIHSVTRGTIWEDETSRCDSFTRTATGIKLLAYLIKKDKLLALWWD